jgi:NAD(P)H-hydrate repair Nnr-like enzyme with NAD(P)H-hydrate epimerase domain
MHLRVDGKDYQIDIASESERLRDATQKQRENCEISPAGYGIHWPDVDEDLSIDGLIGMKHAPPLVTTEV